MGRQGRWEKNNSQVISHQSTVNKKGRGQEAGASVGILSPALCRDQTGLGFESPTGISDSVALIWRGSESPTKFLPSALCPLPPAFVSTVISQQSPYPMANF